MPSYNDLANAKLPSLAEMAATMKTKAAQRRTARNPGAVPADTSGGPQRVSLPGEAPITAQPVSGVQPGAVQATQAPPQVTVGMPYRTYQAQPISAQVPQQINQQAAMDPRAARLRALMAQGMSFQQAMQAIQQG